MFLLKRVVSLVPMFIYFHTNGFLSLNKHTLSHTVEADDVAFSLRQRKRKEMRGNI